MAPLTSKGKRWEVAHSFWMIWSWVPMLGFISFLSIAMRVKQVKWLAWGAVYFVPWILAFALPDVFVASVVLAWLGSAFHAFRVRKEYLLRRAAIEAAEEQAQTPPKQEEPTARPIHAPRQRVLNSEEAPALATRATATATAKTAATGVSAVSPVLADSELVAEQVEEEPVAASTEAPAPLPAHPIDLNTATEAEIALLPGVGELLAMRAVSEREVRGGFRSVEEFIKAIGLRPEVIERIQPYAFVIPKK